MEEGWNWETGPADVEVVEVYEPGGIGVRIPRFYCGAQRAVLRRKERSGVVEMPCC